jgi:translation initiation factor IF-3
VYVVIAKTNETLGEMSLSEALAAADQRNLDLVEISPKITPPVCKIMDLGNFLYQQKKAMQKNKKKQKQTEVKGIRLGFRIGEHDLEVKEKQAHKFLEAGNLVRAVMQFKGREMSHIELGLDKIKLFAKALEDISYIESEPKRQGQQVVMVLAPKK